jgi:methyl-CpG-binding domain protein 4
VGRDIKKDEILTDDDERIAWEIGHMTQGPYAIDSWRIFCRDELRCVARGWNGEGAAEGFQPEWMRVLPEDKELRAYLRWMWLKEGFEWDPFTGDKEVASERLTRAAMEGKIVWDDKGGMRIVDDTDDTVEDQGQDPMADFDGEFIA